MKKYILLLISVSCFGQFNPTTWYEFGKTNDTINTHIGGVSSFINTRSDLAAYLCVSVGRIQKFTINGTDLDFSLIGSQKYSVCGNASYDITFFEDNAAKISNLQSDVLKVRSTTVTRAYFPGIVNQTTSGVLQDSNFPLIFDLPNCLSLPSNFFGNVFGTDGNSVFNIPKCLNIGATQGYDGGIRIGLVDSPTLTIYANSALLTSNGGAVEGDLADAISRGVTVIWVTP